MFCACVLACHLQNGSNLQNSALEYNEEEVVIKKNENNEKSVVLRTALTKHG